VSLGLVTLVAALGLGELELPVATATVGPEYPPGALAAGLEADVLLRLELDAEGRVRTATVVELAPASAFDADFARAAVAAAERFLFRPARLDGAPIPVRLGYRLRFTIETRAPPPAPPARNLVGVVVERFDKVPLPGLLVELDIDRATATSTRTGPDGRFGFVGVSTGTHTLRVSGPGVLAVGTEQEIRPDTVVELELAVEREVETDDGLEIDEEEVVRAPRIRKRAVETRLVAREARRIPGTQGDALKVVEIMPGVARAAVGSGALVVWGAAPDDTRTYVDGILVPRLFHLGGVRSTLGPELVESLSLVPGAFSAAWGRALGGLLVVETARADAAGRFTASAAVDALDAALAVQTPLGPRLAVAAAGRYGWLQHTLGRAVPEASRGLVPIPEYWDYQAKLALSLGAGRRIELIGLGAGDAIERRRASLDPAAAESERRRLDHHRLGLRWTALREDGSSLDLTAWIGPESDRLAADFGGTPVVLDRSALRGAIRAVERARLRPGLGLAAGIDLELGTWRLERSGALTAPAREGDVAPFGVGPGDRVAGDAWSSSLGALAAFATLEWAPIESLLLEPGLRVEATWLSGDRVAPARGDEPRIGHQRLDLGVEPRLTTTWRPSPAWALKAALGLHAQPPDPADLSPVFGNPRLGPAGALHTVLGGVLRLEPASGLELEAELSGFYVRSWARAGRAPEPTPAEARALVDDGDGRSLGAQLQLRAQGGPRWTAWASYTLLRAERRDPGAAGWRPFDGDQTHVLSLIGQWAPVEGLSLGGRLRVASGAPRTPVVGAVYDASAGAFAPLYGPRAGERLPPFAQLDLRAEYTWRAAPWSVSAYLEVLNVTDRDNPEELAYRFDFAERATITGLPITPVLGVRGAL
jgi:TonB family protein